MSALLLLAGAHAARPDSARAAPVDAGCFQKATTAKAPRVPAAPPPPFVIGDSIMVYSVPLLGEAGFDADAKPCRSFKDAVSLVALKARHHTLPRVVVIALGANGPFTLKDIQRVLRILGPARHLALLTARFSRDRPGYGVPAIRAAGRIYTERVRVLDWVTLSTGHPDWFAADGVHLGSQAGIRAYTELLQRGRQPGDG